MVSVGGTTEEIPSDTTGNRSRDRPTSSTVPHLLSIKYKLSTTTTDNNVVSAFTRPLRYTLGHTQFTTWHITYWF